MLQKDDYLNLHAIFWSDRYEKWPNEEIQHASYDVSEKVTRYKWRPMASDMVADYLRELANSLNAWGCRIEDLKSWAKVTHDFDEERKWIVQHSIIESVSHFCLHQPYSVLEKFIHSTIQILLQSNLATMEGYKDYLPQDEKNRLLSRKEKLKVMKQLGGNWKNYLQYETQLSKLNCKDFIENTFDFRNLANHSFPAHITEGYGISVTRRMDYANKLVDLGDGSFNLVVDKSKKTVVYGFGGMPPLDLQVIVEAVIKQHQAAVSSFNSLSLLVDEIVQKLDVAS